MGTREDTGERNRCEPRTGGEAAGERKSERRVGKTDLGAGNAAGRQRGWPGRGREGDRAARDRAGGPGSFWGPSFQPLWSWSLGCVLWGPRVAPFWPSSPILPGEASLWLVLPTVGV